MSRERQSKTMCCKRLNELFQDEYKNHDDETINFKSLDITAVEVKTSGLKDAGLGLFALKDFDQNDVIAEYYGKIIHLPHNIEDFYYIAALNSKLAIDGNPRYLKKPKGGSMINDAKDSKLTNCHSYAKKRKLFVVASKKINKNQEFFLDYGTQYWNIFHLKKK